MGSGQWDLGATCPAPSPSSSKTLTGSQPPVIGRSPHRLIPHIPIVDQILHQGVHVTCWGRSSIGALGMAPAAQHKQSPRFPIHTPASLLLSKYSTE